MQIITRDDFIDIASKATQRGVRFVLGKIRVDARGRTKSSFNEVDYNAANWWSIPAVSSRLRERVTGDPSLGYEDYVVERYLKHRCNLRLVSLGCGVGTHEAYRYLRIFGLQNVERWQCKYGPCYNNTRTCSYRLDNNILA